MCTLSASQLPLLSAANYENSGKADVSFVVFSTSLPFAENSYRLTHVRHSSRKSSAIHFYQCVQHFRVSKQWYGCQCLGLLTCAQMLLHVITHGGCTETVRESALQAVSGRKMASRTGTRTRVSVACGFSIGRCTS